MITDKTIIDGINQRLYDSYRVIDGRPIYRIVWSDDQLELRLGTFTDWYGHILIRQEHKALREIKKYWYLKRPCWLLEKLVFMPSEYHLKDILEELVQARNGTYEPVYVFNDRDNNPIPVVESVVEFIINSLHNPQKRTKKDFEAMEKLEEKGEVKFFEDQLGENERSPLFVWDNSAFVSTNQMKFREEYKEPLGHGI